MPALAAIPHSTEEIRTSPTRWLVLAVMSLGIFLILVDNTIVNTALPAISRDLSASTSTLQWVIDSYTLVLAGLLLLVASAMDLLDGALARLTDQASRFGAVLDSTSDRLAESVVLLGLLVLYFDDDSAVGVVLVFLVLVASFMVSYLRARGEGLGFRSDVGLMTRPERIIVLAIGMIVSQVLVALAIIFVLSTFTAGQRFHHLWRETTRS